MIKLDSDINVKKIKEFHSAILDELKSSDEVLIDFSDVERIDLSVAQLVIASGRAAKAAGKTIKLKSVPRFVKYQMQICGIKI
ncbi:MAG TPA: STAS domain-containing protein [Spirochaetota bacterium]|jgi:anti-anti-sigma regulatory factor|nr:STAS domain-containing protein [Spirochaetota bacterium]HPV42159.1 STAS domain-containing protein [Spirochaetota bacterium]